MSATFEISAAVKVAKRGNGVVQSTKTGWFTIVMDNGDTIKARAKDLSSIDAVKAGYVKAGICTYDPARYTKHDDVRTESGRKSFDTGDSIATKLRGKTLEEVYAIAAKGLGESIKDLAAKYSHLNPGQQRMCLGNRLRHV